jgi:Zn-dependent protease
MPITLLFENPVVFIIIAISLVMSLTIHEFSHAFVAYKLGDSTAKYMGRLSLDPRAHLDPLGTLLLLYAGFGWGKPVPFDATNLKHPKRDSALIAFAGPLSNISLAIILSIILRIFSPSGLLLEVAFVLINLNLILAFFNLIPLHPLDGFKVVYGVLPEKLALQWLQMAPYGIFLLIFLILTKTTSSVLQPLLVISLRLLGLSS